jgi:class 3 adenylate cyclase
MNLREGLANAVGVSEYAIVISADIRGFSDFSDDHESPDVATYIREVFIQMIDEYFPFGSFFKSTGDGLMITVHFDRDTVVDMLARSVSSAVRCVEDFPTFSRDNPMITFATPTNLGIGIARGTTCCLMTDGKILDYSGQLMNLAARLQDLARPRGVVMDGAFGHNLLNRETQEMFIPAKAYIRGIAETAARDIFILKDVVQISEQAHRPYAAHGDPGRAAAAPQA